MNSPCSRAAKRFRRRAMVVCVSLVVVPTKTNTRVVCLLTSRGVQSRQRQVLPVAQRHSVLGLESSSAQRQSGLGLASDVTTQTETISTPSQQLAIQAVQSKNPVADQRTSYCRIPQWSFQIKKRPDGRNEGGLHVGGILARHTGLRNARRYITVRMSLHMYELDTD